MFFARTKPSNFFAPAVIGTVGLVAVALVAMPTNVSAVPNNQGYEPVQAMGSYPDPITGPCGGKGQPRCHRRHRALPAQRCGGKGEPQCPPCGGKGQRRCHVRPRTPCGGPGEPKCPHCGNEGQRACRRRQRALPAQQCGGKDQPVCPDGGHVTGRQVPAEDAGRVTGRRTPTQ